MRKICGGTIFAIKKLAGWKVFDENIVGLKIQGRKNSKDKTSRLDEIAGWKLLARKIRWAINLLWEELEGQTISDEKSWWEKNSRWEKSTGWKIHDKKDSWDGKFVISRACEIKHLGAEKFAVRKI